MATTTSARDLRDSYFDLVRTFPLRPIRTDAELDRAIQVFLKLTVAAPHEERDAGVRDYLGALSLLIEQYERGRRDSALPKLAPADRIQFLMEERGMTVGDLGRVIGSQPAASLIVNRKRSPSKSQIIKLSRHFGVSSALFIE